VLARARAACPDRDCNHGPMPHHVSLGDEPTELVGRDAERATVAAFVGSIRDGPSGLVIGGEPGIGKTALLREALERCRADGYRVLRSQASEEEMPFAMVGVLDLFEHEDVDHEAFASASDPIEQGRATLDGVRTVAAAGPVVVALDDLQWIDPASARSLRFTLRRLEAERVGFMATIRSDADPPDPLTMGRVFPPDRFDRVDLGPLDRDALRELLARRLDRISRPTLDRIHRVSGGNPLYALELAGALGAEGLPDAEPELPSTLRGAIEARL
jgi:predicted ATPase